MEALVSISLIRSTNDKIEDKEAHAAARAIHR